MVIQPTTSAKNQSGIGQIISVDVSIPNHISKTHKTKPKLTKLGFGGKETPPQPSPLPKHHPDVSSRPGVPLSLHPWLLKVKPFQGLTQRKSFFTPYL